MGFIGVISLHLLVLMDFAFVQKTSDQIVFLTIAWE